MTGRIQLMIPKQVSLADIRKAIANLIEAARLPQDATLAGHQWEPILAVTRIAVSSQTFAHCCPWSPGHQPASLPLNRMEPGWWLAPDWPTLERIVAQSIRRQAELSVGGHA